MQLMVMIVQQLPQSPAYPLADPDAAGMAVAQGQAQQPEQQSQQVEQPPRRSRSRKNPAA